jgi:Tol biopolymer transport system component
MPADQVPRTGRRAPNVVIAVILLCLAATDASALAARATTEQVDLRADGMRPDVAGVESSLSADGRFIAFSSSATNLVPDDTNGALLIGGRDVFLRDRVQGDLVRVSLSDAETQGSDESDQPAVSADGRFVAFSSYASNLVGFDTNRNSDVFVRDRKLGTTTLVSVSSDGEPGNAYSANPSISAGGRLIAFESLSTNLAPVTGFASRIYVHDRRTGETTLLSGPMESNATEPDISSDGRVVAYTRSLGRTTGVFARRLPSGRTTRVDVSSSGKPARRKSYSASISASGRYVAFASLAGNLVNADGNGGADIFVRDRRNRTTTRASIRSNGSALRGCPSADAGFAPDCTADPSISGSGRYVSFVTESARFDNSAAPGGAFVRDLSSKTTQRVSFTTSGKPAPARLSSISTDGRFVTFQSFDAFPAGGIFVRGPLR